MKPIAYCVLALAAMLPISATADRSVIKVYTDENNCPIYTRTETKNCAHRDGRHERNRSCRKKNQKIVWRYTDRSIDDPMEITMKPNNPNIFAKGCRERKKRVVCRVSRRAANGSYEYNIENSACKLDPRIIIY